MKNELTTENPELEALIDKYFAVRDEMMRLQSESFELQEQIQLATLAIHLDNDPVTASMKDFDLTLPNAVVQLYLRREILTRGIGLHNTHIRVNRRGGT